MTGLDRLFDPSAIAIAGLSQDTAKHGGRVLGHLRRLGFDGTIWGVHPEVPDIGGVDMFSSIAELPHPPDLVISTVPANVVTQIVADCTDVGAVIVFAGGYGESGPSGKSLENRLRDAAVTTGVRMLGPNSGGVIRPGSGLAASFLTCLERPPEEIRSGRVGVVTQSGGTGSYLHNLAAEWGSGLAVSLSTGNELDIMMGEAIAAVSHLEDVDVVLAVIETIRDGEVFIESVRSSMTSGKPVVVCRIGKGEHGRSLMRTHTGAMALPETVLNGVLESLGVQVAETPAEALEVAEMIARIPPPSGSRFGIVTHSGGIAIHLADLADREALDLPDPSPALGRRLAPLLDHGVANNPLDMGGIIGGPGRFADVVSAFAESGEFDAVLAVSTAHPPRHSQERVATLLVRDFATPILHLWMAGDQAQSALDELRAAGAAVALDPRSAIRALAALSKIASGRDVVRQEPLTGDAETWGIPFVAGEMVGSSDDVVEAARRVGYPVVLKVVTPEIAHKTDVGGVKVGLADDEAVVAALQQILSSIGALEVHGFRVERFHPGLEVIVGGVVDDTFGPMVSIGLGGVLTELLGDVVISPAPVGPPEARGMIDRLRGRRLFDGYRGSPPADLDRLAELVSIVSRGLVGSALTEVEINPFIWDGSQWVAVDWLASP